MTKLKSVLSFWQEIVFIIVIGFLVYGITINMAVAFQQVVNIVFYGIFIVLIACLIGQFYWKNLILGLQLAVLLGFGSIWMALAVMSDIAKLNKGGGAVFELTFAFVLSIGLIIAAISMPRKYINLRG